MTKHVEHVVKAFGRYNGELIGNGEVGLDVPIKNVEIVFKAFKKHRKYTLSVYVPSTS